MDNYAIHFSICNEDNECFNDFLIFEDFTLDELKRTAREDIAKAFETHWENVEILNIYKGVSHE